MIITCFCLKKFDKVLRLAVKLYGDGCRCPECGRHRRILRQTSELRCFKVQLIARAMQISPAFYADSIKDSSGAV